MTMNNVLGPGQHDGTCSDSRNSVQLKYCHADNSPNPKTTSPTAAQPP